MIIDRKNKEKKKEKKKMKMMIIREKLEKTHPTKNVLGKILPWSKKIIAQNYKVKG